MGRGKWAGTFVKAKVPGREIEILESFGILGSLYIELPAWKVGETYEMWESEISLRVGAKYGIDM